VTIGACATVGGIQALRNFADVREYAAVVYARPDYIRALATSTAIAHRIVDSPMCYSPVPEAPEGDGPSWASASIDDEAVGRARGRFATLRGEFRVRLMFFCADIGGNRLKRLVWLSARAQGGTLRSSGECGRGQNEHGRASIQQPKRLGPPQADVPAPGRAVSDRAGLGQAGRGLAGVGC
jgi:hypothetical protein